MKRRLAFLAATSLAAIAFCAVRPAYAEYSVSFTGDWPKSWPKELDPLRKQSRTLVGPMVEYRHYAIPFTKREELESAWPHLLKVNSKGAALRLVRGPNFFLGGNIAGVVVHCPPLGQEGTTYLDLVVDGDIVDLNRIPLPADTPVIDERFKEGQNKPMAEQKPTNPVTQTKPMNTAPEKKQVLKPDEAIRMAEDSKVTVEFKVQFVTKAVLVKSDDKKVARWVNGHGPEDICLRPQAPTDRKQARFSAILIEKAIKQFNKVGIQDIEKHFSGKIVRVTGRIARQYYDGLGTPTEVEIVIDDLSQLELVN